jgi:hypothetical protein
MLRKDPLSAETSAPEADDRPSSGTPPQPSARSGGLFYDDDGVEYELAPSLCAEEELPDPLILF